MDTAGMTPLERLSAAVDFYARTCEECGHARTELKRAVRECDEAKVLPRRKLAALAGVSRQTMYDWLGEGQL